MAFYFVPGVVQDWLVKSRRAAMVFCSVFALGSAYGFVHCVNELRGYPDSPTSVTPTDAATATGWIRVTGARIDCTRGVAGGSGERSFLLRDTGARDVVVDIHGPCAEAVQDFEGVIDPLTPRRESFLASHGMPFRRGAERYELSTIAGPANARLGLLVCGAMFFGAIALYALTQRSRRRRYPHLV